MDGKSVTFLPAAADGDCMNSLCGHSAPRLTAALFYGAAISTSLMARPGGLAPGTGSVVERPGDVLAASLADDGSVTLAGLFSRVQGVSAPGMARLTRGR